LRVDFVAQLARDGEHDVLLANAGAAARPWILATMAGVDRNDDIATAIGRRRGGAPNDGRCRLTCDQVDDQAVAVGLVRREQKSLRLGRLVELEDDAQLAARAWPGAHRAHHAFGFGQPECARRDRARQIDDDAVGIGQCEDAMLHGRAELENDTRALGAGPDADVVDSRGGS
jgi:hypothetical protein